MDLEYKLEMVERNSEISLSERMEIEYLPKVVSKSLDKNTKGLGEK